MRREVSSTHGGSCIVRTGHARLYVHGRGGREEVGRVDAIKVGDVVKAERFDYRRGGFVRERATVIGIEESGAIVVVRFLLTNGVRRIHAGMVSK